jgi:uncharacterized protein (DUF433 family)
MQSKSNLDIRQRIRDSKIYAWQVAEHLGIHENTLFRMLRRDLTDLEKTQILAAIETIKNIAVKNQFGTV